jgi:hypothetical protein
MTRFDARQAALQRIATKAGKGGQERQRSAAARREKLNKNAVGRNASIM